MLAIGRDKLGVAYPRAITFSLKANISNSETIGAVQILSRYTSFVFNMFS